MLKQNFKAASFSRFALQFQFRIMTHYTMFYDGKTQTGSADLFGMALVHTIEPLKDSLLLFVWDADTGIFYLAAFNPGSYQVHY